MTQAHFAEQLGVDRKTVVRWEAGERLPDGASLLKLVEVFSADVNYILTGVRGQPVEPSLSASDRVLLRDFHAAPAQVQAGVKTALGAFAPSAAQNRKHQRTA
ncbi:helix-turn-helix transcriptional regulator [Achromobacter xylosoxidans]